MQIKFKEISYLSVFDWCLDPNDDDNVKENVTNLFHSITNTTKCHKIAVVWQHHNGIISIIHIGEGYKFQKTWYRKNMYVK